MTDSRVAELPPETRERIARAIHEGYRNDQGGRKPADDPAMAEWDALPDHLRESNRQQSGHIVDKLRALGYTVQEVGDGEVELVSFTLAEIEHMAEMEHDRWMAERLADGWTLGKERDVLGKISPHLVSWEELPAEVREWDREPVRRIPTLLAGVALEIRRASGESL